MRRAIFGGSFNPIHNDHIRLCERFYEEFSLDKVTLIPTSTTPLKDNSSMASSEDRLRMCGLASADIDFIEVSDIEVRREGLSYTSDTVRELSGYGDELFLIVGADMFLTLEKWHECEYLFSQVTVLAAPRDESDINILKKKYKELKPLGCKALFSQTPIGDLSSTAVREKLKRGEDLSLSLHPDVLRYIRKRRLYL